MGELPSPEGHPRSLGDGARLPSPGAGAPPSARRTPGGLALAVPCWPCTRPAPGHGWVTEEGPAEFRPTTGCGSSLTYALGSDQRLCLVGEMGRALSSRAAHGASQSPRPTCQGAFLSRTVRSEAPTARSTRQRHRASSIALLKRNLAGGGQLKGAINTLQTSTFPGVSLTPAGFREQNPTRNQCVHHRYL